MEQSKARPYHHGQLREALTSSGRALLEEKGILERHDFGGGRARYEPAEHGEHHHLIDIDTGGVLEFSDERHEELAREIAARLGFELVGHRLELFGRKFPEPRPGAAAPTPRRRQRERTA